MKQCRKALRKFSSSKISILPSLLRILIFSRPLFKSGTFIMDLRNLSETRIIAIGTKHCYELFALKNPKPSFRNKGKKSELDDFEADVVLPLSTRLHLLVVHHEGNASLAAQIPPGTISNAHASPSSIPSLGRSESYTTSWYSWYMRASITYHIHSS